MKHNQSFWENLIKRGIVGFVGIQFLPFSWENEKEKWGMGLQSPCGASPKIKPHPPWCDLHFPPFSLPNQISHLLGVL